MTLRSQRSRDLVTLRGLSKWLNDGAVSPHFAAPAWAAALDRYLADDYLSEPRNRPPVYAERNILIATSCLYREQLIQAKIKKRYVAAGEIAAECKGMGINISCASVVRLCSTHARAARQYIATLREWSRSNAKPGPNDIKKRHAWIEKRLRDEWQSAQAIAGSVAPKIKAVSPT